PRGVPPGTIARNAAPPRHPRKDRPMTTTALTEMERRLRALIEAASRGPLTPEDEAAWNAPYGRSEYWDLRIEHREAPGPHGPVPLRVYTPIAPADGARPVLVFCHGGARRPERSV